MKSKTYVLSVTGSLLLTSCLNLAKEAKIKNTKPNVLFISIDDLNDWVGCLNGHPQAKTPNIDRLAKEGVLFTRTYTAAPACLPSRAALMTSVAPHRSGCYVNNNDQQWQPILLPIATTLPEHFRNNGYYTSGAGKVFHHYQNHPDSWDDYYPSKRLQFPNYYWPDLKERPDFKKFPKFKHWYASFDWGPIDKEVEDTGDYHSVLFCKQELKKKGEKPFFLTCGIYSPHVPWYAPRKYFDMFPLDKIQLPPKKLDDYNDIPKGGVNNERRYYGVIDQNGYHKQAVQGYLASIAYMDDLVGRMIAALDASEHADNTIVVFWSDHGWYLGEKLTYRKFTLWEESCRVPMIIRLPKSMRDQFKQGVSTERTTSLLDIYPTLLELCNLPQPKQDLSGNSLVPLLKNPEAEWNYPSLTTNGYKNHSIRTERWRYTRYSDGGEELYDHNNDPYEWDNLANDSGYVDVLERLRLSLPKENLLYVKTEPFNWKKQLSEALKEVKEKKLRGRIFNK